jgi:large subunit ribosomal protein L9
MEDDRGATPVNVKVILQTEVAGLGEEGEVKDVAGGYARNYLLPRKLAVPATKGNLKVLEQQREQIARKQEHRRAQARELAERLAGVALQFDVRVGAQGRLYGSITAQDIAERVRSVAGVEVDRRSIDLKEPLRTLGDFDVPVRVAHAVTAHLKVTLRDQNAPLAEPAAAPSAAAEPAPSEPQSAETGSSATAPA